MDAELLRQENERLKARLAHQNAAGFAWNGHMVHGDKDSVAAVVAALSVAQGQGWRPIESAPEDGWFLAFKPGVQVIVGTILDGDHPDCEFDGGVHEAWSHQHVDGITHWQPLPAAPAQPDGVE